MLDEIVHQRNQCAEEQPRGDLAVLDSPLVHRRQRKTSGSPRHRKHQIRDHEDVVPIVVIRGRDVDPPAAHNRPDEPNRRHKFRRPSSRPRREHIP